MRIAEGEEHLDREVLCHQVLNLLKEVHVLVYQIHISSHCNSLWILCLH